MEEQKLITKKYVKKNGEEVIKQYNQKQYNKTFYEKNKGKINIKENCICGGSFSASNKSNHEETRIHKLYELYKKELYLNQIKDEIENI
jgi:hypothetical protein